MPKLTKEQLKQIEDYIKTLPEEEREEKLKEIMSQFDQETQCPFCLMAENKIQAAKVYEDQDFLGVLEIKPANPGHVILFSKRHIKSLYDLSDFESENLIKIIKKFIFSLSKLSEGINTLISEGNLAGQKFDHLVVNMVPRSKKDSVNITWASFQSKPEDLEKIRQSIIENFPVEKTKSESIDESKIKREFIKLKKRLP